MIFVFEDEKKNMFGFYISKKIIQRKVDSDPKSFMFKLKNNGEIEIEKFTQKEIVRLHIGTQNDKVLLLLESVDSKKELIIAKKYAQMNSWCEYDIFNYPQDKQYPMTNKYFFNVMRVRVYQATKTTVTRMSVLYKTSHKNMRTSKGLSLSRKSSLTRSDFSHDEVDEMNALQDIIETPNQLLKVLQKEVESIIFDSEKDSWEINNSTFTSKLEEKSNICVVIQDTRHNIFGGYINKTISTNKWVHDNDCVLFSLKNGSDWSGATYPIIENRHDFRICVDSHDVLFAFGGEDNYTNYTFKDICVYKKNTNKKCTCQPYSFVSDQNALCQGSEFSVKRILVYQMHDLVELKKLIRQQMIDAARQMTGMEIYEQLFDSEKHEWSMRQSQFSSRLLGKPNVMIFIEDTQNNVFGGYISKPLVLNDWMNDKKSFLFSIRKDTKFEVRTFPLKLKSDKKKGKKSKKNKHKKQHETTSESEDIREDEMLYDFQMFGDDHEALFVFGAEETDEGRFLRDCCCRKKDEPTGYCNQFAYDYKNEENALIGKVQFDIKSIVVYQLINVEKQLTLDYFETTKRIKQITNLNVSSVIFDSNVMSWGKTDSKFRSKVNGKKKICIIIETVDDNVIGGFISNKIKAGKWVKDPNCCLFTIKQNGVYDINKYPVKPNGNDFFLCDNNDDVLFGFGGLDNGTKKGQTFKDICVYKQGTENTDYCEQYSFNYNYIENALLGKREMEIVRITVYQLTKQPVK